MNPYPWTSPSSSANDGSAQDADAAQPLGLEARAVDSKHGRNHERRDVAEIKQQFEAWRKIDPALNRIVTFGGIKRRRSHVDRSGQTGKGCRRAYDGLGASGGGVD